MWDYLLNHCGEDFGGIFLLTDKLHGYQSLMNWWAETILMRRRSSMLHCWFWPASSAVPLRMSEEKAVLKAVCSHFCVFNHPLNPNFNLADERYPMSPGVVTVEPTHEILGDNLAAFVEKNATVRYSCWAKRILREEDGRVTGIVYADAEGKYHQVNASKGCHSLYGRLCGQSRYGELFPRLPSAY